jgi:hypothetical protein
LAVRRRSGQEHGIDDELPGRRPCSLAVRCPACPEIGINVDKETIEIASESEAYVNYNLPATGFTNPSVDTNTPCLFPPMETFGFNVNIRRMILMMSPSMRVIHTLLKLKATESIYLMWVIVLM